jgi:hypothetical protein
MKSNMIRLASILAFNTSFESILTADQLAIWNTMKR